MAGAFGDEYYAEEDEDPSFVPVKPVFPDDDDDAGAQEQQPWGDVLEIDEEGEEGEEGGAAAPSKTSEKRRKKRKRKRAKRDGVADEDDEEEDYASEYNIPCSTQWSLTLESTQRSLHTSWGSNSNSNINQLYHILRHGWSRGANSTLTLTQLYPTIRHGG